MTTAMSRQNLTPYYGETISEIIHVSFFFFQIGSSAWSTQDRVAPFWMDLNTLF